MGAGASGMRGQWPQGMSEGSNVDEGVNKSFEGAAQEPAENGGRGGRGGRGNRDPHTFGFAVWQIKDGEDKIIADRLVEIFSKAPKA